MTNKQTNALEWVEKENLILVQECIKHMLRPDEARQILARCGELRDIGISLFNILGTLTMLEHNFIERHKQLEKE